MKNYPQLPVQRVPKYPWRPSKVSRRPFNYPYRTPIPWILYPDIHSTSYSMSQSMDRQPIFSINSNPFQQQSMMEFFTFLRILPISSIKRYLFLPHKRSNDDVHNQYFIRTLHLILLGAAAVDLLIDYHRFHWVATLTYLLTCCCVPVLPRTQLIGTGFRPFLSRKWGEETR